MSPFVPVLGRQLKKDMKHADRENERREGDQTIMKKKRSDRKEKAKECWREVEQENRVIERFRGESNGKAQ